jgi:hypothetical protein
MTTFLLLKNHDHYAIVNDHADFIVGRVYPLNGQQGPYKVTADVGPLGVGRLLKPASSTRSAMRSRPFLPTMKNIHCDGTGSTIRIGSLRCS